MHFRKIINLGKSSYVVSLPSSWAKKNNLSKGDVLRFYENKDSDLILSINDKKPIQRQNRMETINVDRKNMSRIRREILSAYIRGFQQLKIIGNVRENRSEIMETLQDLIGTEILDQGKTLITANDIFDLKKFSAQNSLRKMDLAVRNIFTELKNFNGRDTEKNIKIYDNSTNRYMLLFRRVYRGLLEDNNSESLGLSLSEILNLWELSHHFERVSFKLKNLYFSLLKIKNKNHANALLNFIREISDYYENVMAAYYSKNSEKAFELADYKSVMISRLNDLFKNNRDLQLGMSLELANGLILSVHKITRRVYD